MSEIRKPPRMLSIPKRSERRLVEYFVVVSSLRRDRKKDDNGHHSIGGQKTDGSGFEPSIPEPLETDIDSMYEPVVTSRYPLKNHRGNPLSESVTCFCHPRGIIRLKYKFCYPKVHYFVMTGERGAQLYGTCLTIYEPCSVLTSHLNLEDGGMYGGDSDGNDSHSVNQENEQGRACDDDEITTMYLPKCICLLSVHPYLVAFREYLTQLHRLATSGGMILPLERYITNFCSEIPAPPPGSFEVQTTILDSVIKFWSPPHNQPIPWISLPFSHLFECLDIPNIIIFWHALALERQILVTSTQLSLLTTCCEIILSLLYPIKWSHAYIPVLPRFMTPILSAPMPYLCGMDKRDINHSLCDLSNECIVVDLDTNQVTFGPDTKPLPPIPLQLTKNLHAKMTDNAGMIFREARSLTKNDNFSNRGQHLPIHTKVMADAMWDSKLSLYDEAFQLAFTAEKARDDFLNGNDNSGMESELDAVFNPSVPIRIMTTLEKKNLRMQSRWDAVQEAFMLVYVSMLKNYRKCLVFPSKDGDGSSLPSDGTDGAGRGTYGGAGFRSETFISSQRSEVQPFLRELIQTQMFDDFVTKRLYGSGAADVAFFDLAIDKHLKSTGLLTNIVASRGILGRAGRGVLGRMGSGNRQQNHDRDIVKDEPLLQSARIHRKLKTIVPPEPSGADLPSSPASTVIKGGSRIDDNDKMIESLETCGTHSTTSAGITEVSSPTTLNDKKTYKYDKFPTKLVENLFGTPRPIPHVIEEEFNRQKENAAKFRRKGVQAEVMNKENPAEYSTSPEVTTFTVFFMVFTALVGKELDKFASDDAMFNNERTIMSTYFHRSRAYGTSDDSSSGDSDLSTGSDSSNTNNRKSPVSIGANNLSGGNNIDSKEHERFHDSLTALEIEEAKATAKAQLGLAFEMLVVMKERKLKTDPVAFRSLIDACGRCGDTERATKLLARMHEDGIVADGVVYSCLVSAFSAENAWRRVTNTAKLDLPEWANGATVDVDWNKLQKRGWKFPASMRRGNSTETGSSARSEDDNGSQSTRSFMGSVKSIISGRRSPATHKKVEIDNWEDPYDEENIVEKYVTDSVLRQINFGENLLEILYPDINIDTDNEHCPRCNLLLSDNDVTDGWKPGDPQDYTTQCPQCPQKFVPHFCVQTTAQSFVGSKGPESPLFCERLSPWVLEKELRLKMSDREGLEDILDPTWREKENKNAVLWWNLILSFMRFRCPFTFLLQGSFEQKLIGPMPDDEPELDK